MKYRIEKTKDELHIKISHVEKQVLLEAGKRLIGVFREDGEFELFKEACKDVGLTLNIE